MFTVIYYVGNHWILSCIGLNNQSWIVVICVRIQVSPYILHILATWFAKIQCTRIIFPYFLSSVLLHSKMNSAPKFYMYLIVSSVERYTQLIVTSLCEYPKILGELCKQHLPLQVRYIFHSRLHVKCFHEWTVLKLFQLYSSVSEIQLCKSSGKLCHWYNH